MKQRAIILSGKAKKNDSKNYDLIVAIGIFEKKEEMKLYSLSSPELLYTEYYSCVDDPLAPVYYFKNNCRGRKIDKRKITTAKDGFVKWELNKMGDFKKAFAEGAKNFMFRTSEFKFILYGSDHPPAHFHVVSKQKRLDLRFGLQKLNLIGIKRGTPIRDDIENIDKILQNNPDKVEEMRQNHLRNFALMKTRLKNI